MPRTSATSSDDNDTVLVVYITCPDADCAQAIASELVTRHAAACVSVLPGVQSTYRWQGRIETATESLLMVKTRAARLDAVRACVNALHPDEVPELIALQVSAGAPAYLDWVVAETASRTDADSPNSEY